MCPVSSSWGAIQPPQEWGLQWKELNAELLLSPSQGFLSLCTPLLPLSDS